MCCVYGADPHAKVNDFLTNQNWELKSVRIILFCPFPQFSLIIEPSVRKISDS